MGMKRILVGVTLFVFVFSNICFAENIEEIKFGFFTDRNIVATQTILFNEALNRRITEIGNRVAKASGGPAMKYTFRVVNDPTINAFSAAGGFIYINTGLLDILESEDELAAVMAHELVHTNKNHQIEFVYAAHRRKVAGEIIGLTLGVALGVAGGMAVASSYSSAAYASSSAAQSTANAAMNLGYNVGGAIGNMTAIAMIKGYGKEQELEADALSVQYTKKAGYDPNALIGVFKKLATTRDRLGINDRNYVSSLINAEPGLDERIKNAELILNPDKNK